MSKYGHMPNIRMVAYDDWIEVLTVDVGSGLMMTYAIYRDNKAIRKVINEDGSLDELCEENYLEMDTFSALTEISDAAARNVEVLEDFHD